MVVPEASEMATAPAETKFVVKFSFENDGARSSTTAPHCDMQDGRMFWMDNRQIAVENTVSDTLMNVALMKQTVIGEEDVLIS